MNNEIMTNQKKGRRNLKAGSFSIIICAIVLAVVVVLNILVSTLPASWIKLDLTEESYYSIGEETKKILDSVDEDVRLYLIAESGKEDTKTLELLGRYADANSHITLKVIDPAVQPNFTSKYTDTAPSSNSIIVESDKRSSVLDAKSLTLYVTDSGNMTEDEYNQASNSYQMYGQSLSYSDIVFQGELKITGAIDYVTKGDIPVIYTLEGHGETAIADDVKGNIEDENYKFDSLNLLTAGSIPDDCSVLFIGSPTNDIDETEVEAIKAYIKAGGGVILGTYVQYYSAETMPNLTALCEYMGMTPVAGIVIESSQDNYATYPYYLVPELGSTGPVGKLTDTKVNIVMPLSHAITTTDSSDATVNALLSTSSSAYIKPADAQSIEKTDGDQSGIFNVAMVSELTGDDGNTSGRMAWFATPGAFEKGYSNPQLFIATIKWMSEDENVESSSISIIAKSLIYTPLEATASDISIWSWILIGIIPAAVLTSGFVIWFRRRRR